MRNGIIDTNVFVACKNANAAAMWIANQQENGGHRTKDLEFWKKNKKERLTDYEDHIREQFCLVPLRRVIAYRVIFAHTQRLEEKRMDSDAPSQFVDATLLCRIYNEIMNIDHNKDFGKSLATMREDGTGEYLSPRLAGGHVECAITSSLDAPARVQLTRQ